MLCENDTAFHALFPSVTNYVGNFDFGLSNNSELIRLYDGQLNLVDALTYNDEAPWPTEPDGNGPTLSLLSPSLDNSLPQSWGVSSGHGTPGALNEFAVDVKNDENLPTEFKLKQNFPNPFNPITNISFDIPESGKVTLMIFDILGNEVKTLINEYKAGNYNIGFNASNLSSGIYIYQLQLNDKIARRKLVLLK